MNWKDVAHHAITAAMLVGIVWAFTSCASHIDDNRHCSLVRDQ